MFDLCNQTIWRQFKRSEKNKTSVEEMRLKGGISSKLSLHKCSSSVSGDIIGSRSKSSLPYLRKFSTDEKKKTSDTMHIGRIASRFCIHYRHVLRQ